jgi:hypothetical protein
MSYPPRGREPTRAAYEKVQPPSLRFSRLLSWSVLAGVDVVGAPSGVAAGEVDAFSSQGWEEP